MLLFVKVGGLYCFLYFLYPSCYIDTIYLKYKGVTILNTYTAVVHRRSLGFITESNITVTRQTKNNRPGIAALIRDFADPCDHRTTTIRFAGGSLRFSAAYDGPIRPHTIHTFSDSNLSLHRFLFHGQTPQSYLCSDRGFSPIHVEQHGSDFKITIYQPSPVPQRDTLRHSVLAVITKTQTYEDGFAYRIQACKMPRLLLASVFSLPFTLNL